MKPIGPTIKRFLDKNGLTQKYLADTLSMPASQISVMLQKATMDADKYERICVAIGMHPMTVFEYGEDEGAHIMNVSDLKEVSGITNIGNAAVNIGDSALARIMKEKDKLIAEKDKRIEEKSKLIEEKERTIRILMRQAGLSDGTDSRQEP
ncbi:MAG: helix-turn-helix domain-containing protein [Muribaculaceae bacterium]|nr:helix-turn-helix domain-containing protein [Muribaculaceae bacterium]